MLLGGGPFTSADEVDEYLEVECDEIKARNRLRDEVRFARDSTRSLPRKTCPYFKMMVKDATSGRRRMKTTEEFVISLKCLLGKADVQRVITIDDFKNALDNYQC